MICKVSKRWLGLIRLYISCSAKPALAKKEKKVYFELNLQFQVIITPVFETSYDVLSS